MTNHFKLDPNFSVYSMFMNTRPLNIFSERRRMLAYWCAAIEKTVAIEGFKTTIFAGFQQLEYFMPLVKRYQSIAEVVDKVYVFGQPYAGAPQIDNLHYVHLEADDQLTREWFLIVHHPLYSRSLAALELSKADTEHSERTFRGILTSDAGIVAPIHHKLLQQVEKV